MGGVLDADKLGIDAAVPMAAEVSG